MNQIFEDRFIFEEGAYREYVTDEKINMGQKDIQRQAFRFCRALKGEESPERKGHPAVESTDGGNFMTVVTENNRCIKGTGTPTGTARPQQG